MTVHSEELGPFVVVRLAGLPASFASGLHSDCLVVLLEEIPQLEASLTIDRHAVVEAMDRLVPSLPPPVRALALNIKRDCFNKRPLEKHGRQGGFSDLDSLVAGKLTQILTRESDLVEKLSEFEGVYRDTLEREMQTLLGLYEDLYFLRGLALSTPQIVGKLRKKLKTGSSGRGGGPRDMAKWERSLLRYGLRASTKLSANSTLTASALMEITSTPRPSLLSFSCTAAAESSLVRLNRQFMEECQAVLLLHPEIRHRSHLAWNPSIRHLGEDRYSFRCDPHWGLAHDRKTIRFHGVSRRSIHVPEVIYRHLETHLGTGTRSYASCLAGLESALARSSSESAELTSLHEYIGLLIEMGFLRQIAPWPTDHPHLERVLFHHLEQKPPSEDLARCRDLLEGILASEQEFANTEQPDAAVSGLRAKASRLRSSLYEVTELAIEQEKDREPSFFEDVVWFCSSGDGEPRALGQVEPRRVTLLLDTARHLSRFASLWSGEVAQQASLRGWWRELIPSRKIISFVDFVDAFGSLWKRSFLDNQADTLRQDDVEGLDEIEEIRASRALLLETNYQELRESGDGDILSLAQLEHLSRLVPQRYWPKLPPALFVQALDDGGNKWVLNHLSDGSGRYLSRLTPALEKVLQEKYLTHMTLRALPGSSESAHTRQEIVEVVYPKRSLVTVHPPQTQRVIVPPGITSSLPAERRLSLEELSVRFERDRGELELLDRDGRPILPVFMTSMSKRMLPGQLQLLMTFGPIEFSGYLPFSRFSRQEGCRVSNRLTCSSLVIRRKRWVIDGRRLKADLEGERTSKGKFLAIERWRDATRIPRQAFFLETTRRGSRKPQYVDFSSPALVSLFAVSLNSSNQEAIEIEEALPTPDEYPMDSSGIRRAMELLVDGLAVTGRAGPSACPELQTAGVSLQKGH